MVPRELPLQSTTAAEWMMAHILDSPPPIRVTHADLAIPDVLTALVMRCLNKNRDLRLPSARDFIREVEQVEREIDASQNPGKPSPRLPNLAGPQAGNSGKASADFSPRVEKEGLSSNRKESRRQ